MNTVARKDRTGLGMETRGLASMVGECNERSATALEHLSMLSASLQQLTTALAAAKGDSLLAAADSHGYSPSCVAFGASHWREPLDLHVSTPNCVARPDAPTPTSKTHAKNDFESELASLTVSLNVSVHDLIELLAQGQTPRPRNALVTRAPRPQARLTRSALRQDLSPSPFQSPASSLTNELEWLDMSPIGSPSANKPTEFSSPRSPAATATSSWPAPPSTSRRGAPGKESRTLGPARHARRRGDMSDLMSELSDSLTLSDSNDNSDISGRHQPKLSNASEEILRRWLVVAQGQTSQESGVMGTHGFNSNNLQQQYVSPSPSSRQRRSTRSPMESPAEPDFWAPSLDASLVVSREVCAVLV
jgi:hypothetical protein